MSDPTEVEQLLATAQAVADRPDAEVAEIEAAAVEVVSAFEARLQHHFARGPFYVKLRNRLKTEGSTDLAQSVYHYYLATNVLKHGGGKSYRELVGLPDQPFTLQEQDGKALIDVTENGFLGGLIDTLTKAKAALATT